MKFLHLVLSNLKRKKLRTLLTLACVFTAFLLFGLLNIIEQSFSMGVSVAGEDRLIVRHKVSLIMPLPESYDRRILNIDGVDAATHLTWFNGIYQDEPGNFFASMPVSDPDTFLDLHPELLLSDEEVEKWRTTRTGAIVGSSTAQRFGWEVGDRVPLKSPIWPNKSGGAWEFDIVGIYEGAERATDTTSFQFRYDYFDEGRSEGEGMVGWYVVRVDDADNAEAAAKAIDEEFANSPYETKTEPEGAFIQGFVQQVGDIGAMLIAILAMVFFTILLVTGNTMAQSVRERGGEIGVLKALGFSNGLILALVLAESCVIALLGGLAGLGASWALTLGGSPVPNVLPVFYLPKQDLINGVVLVFGLGLLTGLLPALQAMRLRVAVALRRQG